MARNQEFDKSLKTFERSLAQLINKKAREIGKEVCMEVAETFKEVAGNRLIDRAEPVSSSTYDVINIANSITAEETDNGAVARIPIDEEGLVMFLEYGTGLVGEAEKHPESSRVGWDYAINRESYITYGNKTGFVFSLDNKSYIPYMDRNDIIGLTSRRYKPATINVSASKNGRNKAYTKKIKQIERKVNTNVVLSQGLRPTRFVYETKMNIKDSIKRVRTVSDLRKELASLRK